MQQATQTQTPDAAALSRQIREQVRQQVRAAQAQARAARDQARQAAQQAEQLQQGQTVVPSPPGPPPGVPEAPVIASSSVPPYTIEPYVAARVENIAIGFFVMIAALFFIVPIARAIARRIVSKPVAPAPLDQSLTEQLQRIENSVDSMAIEIERISEAQRYMARLQSDRAAAPSLPPQHAAS